MHLIWMLTLGEEFTKTMKDLGLTLWWFSFYDVSFHPHEDFEVSHDAFQATMDSFNRRTQTKAITRHICPSHLKLHLLLHQGLPYSYSKTHFQQFTYLKKLHFQLFTFLKLHFQLSLLKRVSYWYSFWTLQTEALVLS